MNTKSRHDGTKYLAHSIVLSYNACTCIERLSKCLVSMFSMFNRETCGLWRIFFHLNMIIKIH